MLINTSELEDAALEWAVAMCERIKVEIHSAAMIVESRLRSMSPVEVASHPRPKPYCTIPGRHQAAFSSDWAQGGPIIERCQITIRHDYNDDWVAEYSHPYSYGAGRAYFKQSGPTPLLAAMRCYVASMLGEEIEVPEELCK